LFTRATYAEFTFKRRCALAIALYRKNEQAKGPFNLTAATVQLPLNAQAGSYSLSNFQLVDSRGCLAQISIPPINYTLYPRMQLTVESATAASCNASKGEVTLRATGGPGAGYEYELQPEGIAAAAGPKLQIWPNPTRGGFWLSWEGGEVNRFSITLFDTQGRAAFEAKQPDLEFESAASATAIWVPVLNLAPGLYTAQIQLENQLSLIEKIVIAP
jgi:hypothetical protein